LDRFVAANRSTLTYSAKPLQRNQEVGMGMHGQGRLAPTSMGTRPQRSHDHAGSLPICWRLGNVGGSQPRSHSGGPIHLEVDGVR
jgi:hypothetical protein